MLRRQKGCKTCAFRGMLKDGFILDCEKHKIAIYQSKEEFDSGREFMCDNFQFGDEEVKKEINFRELHGADR